MVVLSCPWCEDEVGMDFLVAVHEYRCESCGTCVLLADEEEEAFELAA